MGRDRTYTCILFCLIGVFCCTTSCKEDSSEWIHQTKGYSILDLEYINDTLGITLKDIRISEISKDSFRISVYLLPDQLEKYGNQNRFFIHFYPNYSSENLKSFIALGTRELKFKNGALIFERDFNSNIYWYPYVRYGLLDEDGRRLFTLELDSIRINNKK